MKGYVNGIDWINAEAMKYWSFAKTYKGNPKDEIRNFVFSNDYYGALKRDGYYQRLIKDEDDNLFMVARSKNVKGEAVEKSAWAPHLKPYFDRLPNSTVLLCEIYLPNNEGSKNVTTILGCGVDKAITRQKKGTKLQLYVFDVMTWAGEDYYKLGIEKRIEALNQIASSLQDNYVEYAMYYRGKELWEKIGEYLSSGREGVVITRRDCPVYFKRTPARMTIKIKKEINQTIDCFFTGRYAAATKAYTGKEIDNWNYWYNTFTNSLLPIGHHYPEYLAGEQIIPVTKGYYNGWAGSLEIGVKKGDVTVPIGMLSNLTEDIKAKPEAVKGKVIEVTCMEIDEDSGGLRHAKMLQFRNDITIEDCTYEKVFG